MRIAYFDCADGASAELILGALAAAQTKLDGRVAPEAYKLPGGIKLKCVSANESADKHCVKLEFPAALAPQSQLSRAELIGFLKSAALGAEASALAERVIAALDRALDAPYAANYSAAPAQGLTMAMAAELAVVLMKLSALEIGRICYSPVNVGGSIGQNRELIAPAVLRLAKDGNMQLLLTPGKGELLTLDGAAILCALGQCATPNIAPIAIGIGVATGDGITRELKATLGEMTAPDDAERARSDINQTPCAEAELTGKSTRSADERGMARVDSGAPMAKQADAADNTVYVIECNIDDMTPEQLAFACERLMALGALDVWQTPIIMKKGRMAAQLSVLCKAGAEDALADAILRETSTLGVRMAAYTRKILPRGFKSVDTRFGAIQLKTAPGKAAPEYEDCRRAAMAHNAPITDVYDAAKARRDT